MKYWPTQPVAEFGHVMFFQMFEGELWYHVSIHCVEGGVEHNFVATDPVTKTYNQRRWQIADEHPLSPAFTIQVSEMLHAEVTKAWSSFVKLVRASEAGDADKA